MAAAAPVQTPPASPLLTRTQEVPVLDVDGHQDDLTRAAGRREPFAVLRPVTLAEGPHVGERGVQVEVGSAVVGRLGFGVGRQLLTTTAAAYGPVSAVAVFSRSADGEVQLSGRI